MPWRRRKRGFRSVSRLICSLEISRARSCSAPRRSEWARSPHPWPSEATTYASPPATSWTAASRAPAGDERAGAQPRLVAVAAHERTRVDLQQRAGCELVLQQAQTALAESGRPFGMRDQQPVPEGAHVPTPGEERGGDAAEGHFEQHPPCAEGAMRDHIEFGGAEVGRRIRVDLATRVELQRDALPVQRHLQPACALGDRGDREREARVPDVRRDRRSVRALGGQPRCEGETGGLVDRPVVRRRQEMEVKVDVHAQPPKTTFSHEKTALDPGSTCSRSHSCGVLVEPWTTTRVRFGTATSMPYSWLPSPSGSASGLSTLKTCESPSSNSTGRWNAWMRWASRLTIGV